MAKSTEKFKLVFRDDGFEEATQVDYENDEAIFVAIDTENELITIELPPSVSLVKRRTVERRVKSIARSGYTHQGKKVGIGYNIEIVGTEDRVPDVLLQAGHGYQREGGREIPTETSVQPDYSSYVETEAEKDSKTSVTPEKTPSKYEKLGKKIYKQLQREQSIVVKKEDHNIKIKSLEMKNIDEFEE